MNEFWRYPGKEIYKPLKDYTVIDFETNGLDPVNGRIIEYGGVKVRSGVIVSEFDCLCNIHEPLPPFIAELTGISDEMMQEQGIEEEQALKSFLEWLGDDLIVGQNVSFDLSFLMETMKRNEIPVFSRDYEDTLTLSRALCPEMHHHRLSDLCEHYHVVNDQAHRALSDCVATMKVYQAILKQAGDEETLMELMRRNGFIKKESAMHQTVSRSFDKNHPLYGKRVSFSGCFKGMSREEVELKAVEVGAIPVGAVSFTTDYLFCGSNNKGSLRKKKAELLKESGSAIQVLSEEEYHKMIKGQ